MFRMSPVCKAIIQSIEEEPERWEQWGDNLRRKDDRYRVRTYNNNFRLVEPTEMEFGWLGRRKFKEVWQRWAACKILEKKDA